MKKKGLKRFISKCLAACLTVTIMAIPDKVIHTPSKRISPFPSNRLVPAKMAGKSVPNPAQVPSAILCPKATPR